MEWTRSLPMRLVATCAATFLVIVHWGDRGTWFWVGAALLVLNLVGLAVSGRTTALSHRSRRDRGASEPQGDPDLPG